MGTEGRAKQILLLDTDPASAPELQVALRHRGWTVCRVRNLGEARFAIEGSDFDVFVCDPGTEEELFLQFLGNFCARDNPDAVSMLLIVSAANARLHQHALEHGLSEFITRPIASRELIGRVELILRLRELREGNPGALPGRQGGLPGLGLVDLLREVNLSGQACCIAVQSGEERARLWCDAGCLVGADSAYFSGTAAFSNAISWDEGHYTVSNDPPGAELLDPGLPLGPLIHEALRHLDAWTQLAEQIPSDSPVFVREADALADRLEEVLPEWNRALLLVDGHRDLEALVAEAAPEINRLELLGALSNLYFQGFISILDGADGERLSATGPLVVPVSPGAFGKGAGISDPAPGGRSGLSGAVGHNTTLAEFPLDEVSKPTKEQPLGGEVLAEGSNKSESLRNTPPPPDELDEAAKAGRTGTAAMLMAPIASGGEERGDSLDEDHGGARDDGLSQQDDASMAKKGRRKARRNGRSGGRSGAQQQSSAAASQQAAARQIESLPPEEQSDGSNVIQFPPQSRGAVSETIRPGETPAAKSDLSDSAGDTARKSEVSVAAVKVVSDVSEAVDSAKDSSDRPDRTLPSTPAVGGSSAGTDSTAGDRSTGVQGEAPAARAPGDFDADVEQFFSSVPPESRPLDENWNEGIDSEPVELPANKGMYWTAGIFAMAVVLIGGFLIYHKLIRPTPVHLGGDFGAVTLPTPDMTEEAERQLAAASGQVGSQVAAETTLKQPESEAKPAPSVVEPPEVASPVDAVEQPAEAAAVAEPEPAVAEPAVAEAPAEPAGQAAQVAVEAAPAAQPAVAEGGSQEAVAAPAADAPVAAPSAPADVDMQAYTDLLAKARKKGLSGQARKLFQQAIDLNPVGSEALSGLGLANLNRGRNKTARELAERAVASDSTNSEGWIVLGAARDALRDRKGGQAAYRQCVELAKGQYVVECRRMLR